MKPDLGIIKLFAVVLIISIIGISTMVLFLNQRPDPVLAEVAELQSNPSSYDLGDVPRLGGLVTKEFQLTNTSLQNLILRKITTSCMCTQAKVVTAAKETRFFTMESPGDRNAPVNINIPPGESFKVVTNFDPDAHGPKGVGSFDRSIQLYFSQPEAIKELKFSGTII